ncbi:MAG TPA: HlyD family efflux transporter periplasmic adaptor subunit [Chitinophagaceae bacterium]|nr:HlyD family efflux transporter periplasmic adaptor subunit [Chitinophagaceae bacterium]
MKKNIAIYLFVLSFIFCGCAQNGGEGDGTDEAPADVVTPVTVTHPETGSMTETVQVNAVSSFLLKTYAKASVNGYLQEVNVRPGQFVSKGQVLFVIKTKEAQALGNTINSLDTSLHFEGTVTVKSPGSGYITQLTYTAGNYVQDGEQLAEITDQNSFVFILDLPYELKPYLDNNKTLTLHLPDSTTLTGYVQSSLPSVDSVSQTQRYIIKVNSSKLIPANLVAKVDLVKSQKINAVSLPKAAVLSDEAQSEFWIMKMINDSIAVKVPVTKGLETKDNVEITSPPLSASDNILITGNYGLADTAKVKIVKE